MAKMLPEGFVATKPIRTNPDTGRPEFGWPNTVVKLEPNDFIEGEWRKSNAVTKHCTEGWLSALFNPNDPLGSSTSNTHEVVVAREILREELALPKMSTSDSGASLESYNDKHKESEDNKDNEFSKLCSAFNGMFARLGYGTVVNSSPVIQ